MDLLLSDILDQHAGWMPDDLAIGQGTPPSQEARTPYLIFGPAEIVSYISTFMQLEPGDLISTGTCGGVAVARPDLPFLKDGQVATVTIEGIGSCVNVFRAEHGDGG